MNMRQNKNRLEVAAIIAVFVAGALIFMYNNNSTYNIANAQGSQQQKNVVRDSQTILLEGKTIPAKAGEFVTDVAIQNPTTSEIKLPATSSSIVIGVNEIAPLQGGGSSEGN